MRPTSRWWWDLTTEDFSRLAWGPLVAILPVAAVEQHGPHLPVRVDAAINWRLYFSRRSSAYERFFC